MKVYHKGGIAKGCIMKVVLHRMYHEGCIRRVYCKGCIMKVYHKGGIAKGVS